MSDDVLPLAVLATSLVPAVIIFCLREEQHAVRTTVNLLGATLKVVAVAVMFVGYFEGRVFETRIPFLFELDLLLRVDRISLLFAALSAGLWLVTTVYAVGFLEKAPHRSRFFGFFSLSVTATMGIALAGNPITFLVFFEMLTLATYPLVIHNGTPEALNGGFRYLAYTLVGGTVLLVGVAWLHAVAGPVEFGSGGVLDGVSDRRAELQAIFAMLMVGVGVKAAIFPLHGWLPSAMVAPAPVSALLHAVAVVKAGAYGVVRFVYDLYGVEFAEGLGVLGPLAAVAAFTIVYASVQALRQDDLKRRLAYSTVSQVSYIVLGVAILSPIATTGALVHLAHQGIMKITLFFCAGALAETLGITKVSRMGGVGRRMPWTMAAFTVAAFGMIGVPPVAGFVSKWYLGTGALDAGQGWAVAVLLVSAALNAAYFLPVLRRAWFDPLEEHGPARRTARRAETQWLLLGPTLVCGLASLLAGLLAAAPFSPLELAQVISDRMGER